MGWALAAKCVVYDDAGRVDGRATVRRLLDAGFDSFSAIMAAQAFYMQRECEREFLGVTDKEPTL